MTGTNGETQKAERRLKNSQHPHQQWRLGSIQDSSGCNGNEQIGTYSPSCAGQDSVRSTTQHGEGVNGKILERLEFIEQAYFSYVDDHQQRLEARLIESRERKEVFRKAVQELKQEIYDLTSSEEQLEQPE